MPTDSQDEFPGVSKAELEALRVQHDELGAKMRERTATMKEVRTHRAITDFLYQRIDKKRLFEWLARIESGEDAR